MALTLDGTLPALGSMGASTSGVGMGALGGGVAGLLLGGLLSGNRGGGLFGGNNNYDGPAANAVASDIVLNPAFQSLQTQVQTTQAMIGANNIQDAMRDSAADASAGRADINNNLNGTTRDILSGQAAINSNLAQANYTTLSSINGLGRDVTAAQNQAALQNLNSFNQLNTNVLQGFNSVTASDAQTQLQNLNSFNNQTTTMLQGFNSAAMQIQNSTNQIIAQGTANAAAMANCCCEIKEKIGNDGDLTRQLINDLNVQNLRDQLSAANNQVSNFNQNQFLISQLRPPFPFPSPVTTPVIV